jgi:hypothetical protein
VGPRSGLNAAVKKKISRPFRESNTDRSALNLVAVLSDTLSWLLTNFKTAHKRVQDRPAFYCTQRRRQYFSNISGY